MLLDKYQNLLSKDIQLIISHIFDNYNVTDKTSNQIINKNDIIDHFLVEKKEIIKRCCGVLNSGNPCNRSAMKNEVYCKTHLLKYQKKSVQQKSEEYESIIFIKEQQPEILINEHQLQKIFIDDTFFLHDTKFLYDPVTKEKVGLKDTGTNTFVITSDPFLLDSF